MKITFSKKITALIVGMSLISLESIAAVYSCSGIPTGVSVEATSGDVLISGIGTSLANTRYCSVSTSKNAITTEVCKNFYATLLSAQLSDKSVTIYINNSFSCTTNPAWALVNGFYYTSVN